MNGNNQKVLGLLPSLALAKKSFVKPTNGTNKLDCLPLTFQLSGQLSNSFWPFVSNKDKLGHIHNTLFSLKLTNGPNKLDCLPLERFSNLVDNTQAHWTHSYIVEKMRCYDKLMRMFNPVISLAVTRNHWPILLSKIWFLI